MFKNKKVLVAGGVGLIGRQLVELLISEGAYKLSALDLQRTESELDRLDRKQHREQMIALDLIKTERADVRNEINEKRRIRDKMVDEYQKTTGKVYDVGTTYTSNKNNVNTMLSDTVVNTINTYAENLADKEDELDKIDRDVDFLRDKLTIDIPRIKSFLTDMNNAAGGQDPLTIEDEDISVERFKEKYPDIFNIRDRNYEMDILKKAADSKPEDPAIKQLPRTQASCPATSSL